MARGEQSDQDAETSSEMDEDEQEENLLDEETEITRTVDETIVFLELPKKDIQEQIDIFWRTQKEEERDALKALKLKLDLPMRLVLATTACGYEYMTEVILTKHLDRILEFIEIDGNDDESAFFGSQNMEGDIAQIATQSQTPGAEDRSGQESLTS